MKTKLTGESEDRPRDVTDYSENVEGVLDHEEMISDFTDAFSSKYCTIAIEYTITNDDGEEEDRVWEFDMDQIKRVICHWIPMPPIEDQMEKKIKKSRKSKTT